MRSLRIQLLVSHIVLVLLMAGLTGVTIYSFVGIGKAVSQGVLGNARSVRGAQLMNSALEEQRTALWLLLAGSTYQAKATYHTSWDTYNIGLAAVMRDTANSEARELGREIDAQADIYRRETAGLFRENTFVLPDKTQELVTSVLEPQLNQMRVLANNLADDAQTAGRAANEEAKSDADLAIKRTVVVTVIAIALACLLGASLVRTAIVPLGELAVRAEQISHGDLSPRAQRARKDEVGALSEAVESMAAKILEAKRANERQVRRLEQMSDAALEHLYDPVIVLDQKGRIVHLNQAAEILLGPIPDGAKVPVKDHIADRRLAKALDAAAHIRTASASEDEHSLISFPTNGVNKTYRLRATPMRDEEEAQIGSVAVLEDVTHLREVDRLKNEFIGVASHELRTPVSSLLLGAQLLIEGAAGKLTNEQEEIVRTQLVDLERLEKLMRDLLDVTKLEAGSSKPKFAKVSAADIVRAPLESLKSQASKKSVSLESEFDPSSGELLADRSQIGRVLINLIANAIRHTPSGGRIKVSSRGTDNDVTFSVEDSGEGIPHGYLSRIFERFVQVPGATQGGAGLGLSIANNIVRAHGGKMSVESEVGRGSVFSFTLSRQNSASGGENLA